MSTARVFAVVLVTPPLLFTAYELYLTRSYPPIERTDANSSPALMGGPRLGKKKREVITPYCDMYSARVPVAGLLRGRSPDGSPIEGESLEERWARTWLACPTINLEGVILRRLLSTGAPTESTRTSRFQPGEALVGGGFHVFEQPSKGQGLVANWEMPEKAVAQRERSGGARLMDGGRHEWGIGARDGDEVEVTFAAAVDFAVVPAEGERQKTSNPLFMRFHYFYARHLLHEAVVSAKWRAWLAPQD